MPQGSGRTLCGDRARCGVEMNRDTHIRSETREIDERSEIGSGATSRRDQGRYRVPCTCPRTTVARARARGETINMYSTGIHHMA